MFSMTKSRKLDEVQTPLYFVNKRYYDEDVTLYHIYTHTYVMHKGRHTKKLCIHKHKLTSNNLDVHIKHK